MKIELQFRGSSQVDTYDLPLAESPFTNVTDVDEANEIVSNAIMSDAGGDGWISCEIAGHDFQIRPSDWLEQQLADDHAEACCEDEGEAAFGRPD